MMKGVDGDLFIFVIGYTRVHKNFRRYISHSNGYTNDLCCDLLCSAMHMVNSTYNLSVTKSAHLNVVRTQRHALIVWKRKRPVLCASHLFSLS